MTEVWTSICEYDLLLPERGVAALVDGGQLPGTPSTVIDLTGEEPRILRNGALPAEEALRRLGAAVRSG